MAGIFTVRTEYYNDDGYGGVSFESAGEQTFYVATSTTTITLRKFYDTNANGVKDITESYATTPQFELCLKMPSPFLDTICNLTDSETGIVSYDNFPNGTYRFWETAQNGWGQTTPTRTSNYPYYYNGTVTSDPYYLEFGNAQSDMVCDSVAVYSALSSTDQMTFRLNYEKLNNGVTAKNPTIKLYFTQTASPSFTLSYVSHSGSLSSTYAGGSGTLSDPYTFQLSDINSVTTGYIDVVVQLTFPSGRPTSGNLIAYQLVGSTYEPILPNDNTCSKTIPFQGTAVNASSFSASLWPPGSS